LIEFQISIEHFEITNYNECIFKLHFNCTDHNGHLDGQ